MKYIEDNIIGLRLYHKDYKLDDPLGKYTVEYGPDGSTLGLWYLERIGQPLKHSSYDLDTINYNIEKGSWIPMEKEIETYSIF